MVLTQGPLGIHPPQPFSHLGAKREGRLGENFLPPPMEKRGPGTGQKPRKLPWDRKNSIPFGQDPNREPRGGKTNPPGFGNPWNFQRAPYGAWPPNSNPRGPPLVAISNGARGRNPAGLSRPWGPGQPPVT